MNGPEPSTLQALESLEKRLIVLQSLDDISQRISLETDLEALYPAIHRGISRVLGEVDFLIAIYHPAADEIEIPYASEAGARLALPSFKLGQGLTSVLIRSRQPLLLVGDVERRAAALGAQLVGQPAKSWLGVPLLVAGEAIGALIVQDASHAGRFTLEDQLLLTTLAAPVGIAVRNAHLLRQTRQQAERERVLAEISARLWAATDIETILQTTLGELGCTLQAASGCISLEAPSTQEA